MRSRLLTALLVPFGVALGHLGGYSLPGHGSHTAGHGYFPAFVAGAGLLAGGGLLWAAVTGRRGRLRQAAPVLLAAGQLVLFGGLEIGERLVAGHGLAAGVHDTAVWAGLVLQLAAAGVLLAAVRAAPRLAAALFPPISPLVLVKRPGRRRVDRRWRVGARDPARPWILTRGPPSVCAPA